MKKVLLAATLLLALVACSSSRQGLLTNEPVKLFACDGKPYPQCSGDGFWRTGNAPGTLNSNLALMSFTRNKDLFPTVAEYEASPYGQQSMAEVGATTWVQEAQLRGLPNVQ